MSTSVLLFGASGFLGGTVLNTLLEQHKNDFNLTVFSREHSAKAFQSLSIKVEVGEYSDYDCIEQLASQHDVVMNPGDSDDLPLTKAIIKGLTKGRKEGRKGVMIHVSGCQVIEGPGSGVLDDTPIYDDMNVEQLKGISERAFHRLIDLEIVNADLAGDITASIICPATIFGKGTGPAKKFSSSPISNLIMNAIDKGYPLYAGEGTNTWIAVHVVDLANLICLILKHNTSESLKPAGFERYYFAENGEYNYRELAEKIGPVLKKNGMIKSAEAQWAPVAARDNTLGWFIKTNSRARANRARKELGWQPQHKLWDDFDNEMLWMAKEMTKDS